MITIDLTQSEFELRTQIANAQQAIEDDELVTVQVPLSQAGQAKLEDLAKLLKLSGEMDCYVDFVCDVYDEEIEALITGIAEGVMGQYQFTLP